MRSRAKELFPSVLLTLISIVQALALELLWSRLRESPHLWNGGWDALVGWSQVLAMVLGLIQVWVFYTSLVMRFRWLPSLRDSVLPFVIGILEFTLIDLMGPSSIHLWFYALAVVFALSAWDSHAIFRVARQDPDNREFFDSVGRATLRDHLGSAGFVAGLAFVGLVLQVSGSPAWLSFAGLAAAIGAFVYRLEVSRRYWNRAMAPPPA